MRAEDRLQRVLRLLQGVIRAAGYTQTDIDERIGRRRGYLSHVFQRRVDLKLADLLRVLEALQVSPATFFSYIGGNGNGRAAALEHELADGGGISHMMKLVSESAEVVPERPAPHPESSDMPSDELLFERVRAIVHEVLAVSAAH